MSEDLIRDDSFDKLARGLANGTITRRQGLKLFGASVLAALLPASAAGAKRRCRKRGSRCGKKKGKCCKGLRCKQTDRGKRCVKVPPTNPPPTNPLNDFLSVGALTLSGVSPTAFNPADARLTFTLKGAQFSQVRQADTILKVNEQIVPNTKVTVSADSITATEALTDGKNVVRLESVDTAGRPLYYNSTIWAGTNVLRVELVNTDGTPFREEATVTSRLVDDQAVHGQEVKTATGAAQFANVPASTVFIQATASGNRRGEIGVTGNAGTAKVSLRGFNAPSPVANNDFSKGTGGWNVGSAPVQIVPHKEDAGPA
jgi:hypothetical protein